MAGLSDNFDHACPVLVLGGRLALGRGRSGASGPPARSALGQPPSKERRARRHRLPNRLRQNDLPESWIAPPAVREMREIARYWAKLTALRTAAKAQIHAVMAKHNYLPKLDDMVGPGGQVLLDEMVFEIRT